MKFDNCRICGIKLGSYFVEFSGNPETLSLENTESGQNEELLFYVFRTA